MQEVTGSNPVFPTSCHIMKQIYLPDGKSIEVQGKKTFGDVIAEFNPTLAKKALAVKYNGRKLDLSATIEESGQLEVLTFESEEGKELFWHSAAHILAQAVKRLYPDAKFDDGPPLKNGPGNFFYDIALSHKITEEDFPAIEAEMEKIVQEDHPVTRRVLSKKEALSYFADRGEIFKTDIISRLPDDAEVSLYRQGEFEDLCRGPHIPSTGKSGVFKITAVAGAYWKGDAANPMLQRVYCLAFPDRKQLKAYLDRLEEAKKRDHRKLGKELELFTFEEEGPGFPFYLAKGTVLFNILTDYIRRECTLRGYEEIRTPIMLSDELWTISGHYENYKENMYFSSIENHGFAIKPMNCPGSNLVYKSKPRSYRDLPLRQAELGTVHRHELSGVLHGLFRVRSFTQDDAHIYCTPDQLEKEIESAIQFTLDVYKKFGFEDVTIFLATRPEKSIGGDNAWELSTTALRLALKNLNIEYKTKEGEGAFYGPKIEFNIKDCLERNWQCGTIQVDFNLPQRFELEYTGSDGKKHRPVMVHRAILGSLERFIGILIEHYEGKFPLWLSPVQIRILTISEEQLGYAQTLQQELRAAGFRTELDDSHEKIGYKIRQWNAQKINYALIIGAKEAASGQVALRARGSELTETMDRQTLLEKLTAELHQ